MHMSFAWSTHVLTASTCFGSPMEDGNVAHTVTISDDKTLDSPIIRRIDDESPRELITCRSQFGALSEIWNAEGLLSVYLFGVIGDRQSFRNLRADL